jgi:urea transport system substrate-binding protein
MAVSERAVVDATLLAIEELNAGGGLLGRTIEVETVDGASDPDTFARQADRLINELDVSVIFGCWTSASRKAVRPVMERNDRLLFYPVQYEGLESSPGVVYLGATPNQQILPAIDWAIDTFGNRFFLVGSDYVFPRASAVIIRDYLAGRGELIGEVFVPLGSTDVSAMVAGISSKDPDVVLNLINGDTNTFFLEALAAAGIGADQTPVVSFSIGDAEVPSIGPGNMSGQYAVWSYFESLDDQRVAEFVKAFRLRYGLDRVTGDSAATAYLGVKAWAKAVEATGTTETAAVRARIQGMALSGPFGAVYIDPNTQHLWRVARVGRANPDGRFDIVWTSPFPVRPEPFPPSRKRPGWEVVLRELYEGWGRSWEAPR